MLWEALSTARDLGRMQEIASVLIRHGLGDAVRRMGIAGFLERAGSVLHWDGAKGLAEKPAEQHVREALEDLGPTFVKLGQILAGRRDLLAPTWTEELARLHQRAAPVPIDAILAQLREDLGGDPHALFARFDEQPLAAASIAQVHRAALHDGTEVVVKVRRPGIEEVVDKDLRLLARLAELAEQELPEMRRYRPKSLVRQFARSMRQELDLRTEARNAERIASGIAPEDLIDIPRVHAEYTRERVCVMD
jgi:ubiquinone biosynthesis protein